MASTDARIWWFPEPGGDVEEIDAGMGLSDLQRNPVVTQVGSESINGMQSTNHLSARSRVRILFDRFTDFGFARDLRALENHLQRGGAISVAGDYDKAVAGFVNRLPDRNDNVVTLVSRPFPYNASAVLVQGDQVVLQGPSPEYLYEEHQVFVAIGDTYTLSRGVRYSMSSQPWVMFRHQDFWPVLRLPIGERSRTLLTHDHRITWTFDCELEEAPQSLESWALVGDGVLDITEQDPNKGLGLSGGLGFGPSSQTIPGRPTGGFK